MMNSIDLISMGLKNLFRRKLRTFLTTLGIIIGTISIVVMISIGIGMQKQMDESFNQMGDMNIITVSPPNKNKTNTISTKKKKTSITDKDIKYLNNIEGVDAVSPVINYSVTMTTSKRLTAQTTIKGMTLEFMEKYGLGKMKKGNVLTKDDSAGVLFGKMTLYGFAKANATKSYYDPYEEMYDEETGKMKEPKFNPLVNRIYMSFGSDNADDDENTIKPILIKPVGILATTNYQKSASMYMELNQLKNLRDKYDKMTSYSEYGGKKPSKNGYTEVMVHVPDRKNLEAVQKEIQKYGFRADSDADMLRETKKMTQIINLVFGGIGGISLLVAAIGITNTMVMAIYERRKEIGVMKVIGSSIRDIKRLFLFESASIGLLGGILGVILSLGISSIVNVIAGGAGSFMEETSTEATKTAISIIPVWLSLLALAFTAFIGLVSGYLPARKAMKLSALEAIKTE
ncbi:ABC transporter permease [Vallitalea sediminicola]